jgi:hypothetical protein
VDVGELAIGLEKPADPIDPGAPCPKLVNRFCKKDVTSCVIWLTEGVAVPVNVVLGRLGEVAVELLELVAPVAPVEAVELVAAEGLIAPKKALKNAVPVALATEFALSCPPPSPSLSRRPACIEAPIC